MKAVLNKVKPFIFPLAIAVIIYLLMRFVFVFGYVPTASMEPTLSKDMSGQMETLTEWFKVC